MKTDVVVSDEVEVTEASSARPDAVPPRQRRGTRILTGRGFRAAPADAELSDAAISPVWQGTPDGVDLEAVDHYWATHARDVVFRRSLAVADVAGAFGALLLAAVVINGGAGLRLAAVLIAPFVVVASKAIGLYDRDQHILRKTTIDELPSILQLSVYYALSVWLLQSVVLHGSLARLEVFALAVGTFAFVTAGRLTARFIALRATSEERCVVLGNAADAERTASKLASSPGVKAVVVGRIALDPRDASHGISAPSLGDVNSLVRLIAEQRAERVIIAPDGHDQDEILMAIRMLKALGVKVSVLPRLLEVVGSSSTFDEVDGITLLGMRQYGLSKSSRFLKRIMDFCVALTALVLLAPLLIVLSIAIVLDSSGPVLFRQARIGRGGQRFDIFKFRSMVSNADEVKDELREQNEVSGGLFKIDDDPRITRVGRFLRRSSTDELPQLLNVLLGHMSLVGPRPLVPDEDALIEGWERRRLAVRPGMTGLWQIFGSSRIPLPEMVKIDYFYCANWSVWVDIKILLRTVPYVLRRRGQ
jgi:exopolysaccharide biosynthesis polyprenyl glycosylphosphotransferase